MARWHTVYPDALAAISADYQVEEDPDFLTLTCRRCGHRLIFSVLGADPREILAEATQHLHTCQRREE